jgi:23S rRNA (pseudouridine1915-N3)-methyltransferase
MNIDIICVGKIKEKYLREGIKEYQKRLTPYCRLNIIEVAEEKAPENLSEAEKELVLKKEREAIIRRLKISPDSYTITLCVEGKEHTSEEMAENLKTLMLSGKSRITFIIGGSLGLSHEVKSKADLSLSFSKFTFPHQLMRLILTEQIYRWFKIIRGETYHK